MKTKLEIAKQIVKENCHAACHGMYNCRGTAEDTMNTLYDDGELRIDICYGWSYFEVFGLSPNDFAELERFYASDECEDEDEEDET